MLSNSYLILGSAGPTDIGAAVITQRQSIPLVWAIAVSSPTTQFVEEDGSYFFSTIVGEALNVLDRGLAGWNYNTYFRDTLAPVGVFRTWLANYPSDTPLYVNVTELINASPDPEPDIAALKKIGEIVDGALTEIEDKNFSEFLFELRKLSYPFITVPIIGDRKRDVEVLRYEMRDTTSVEAEMALQLVGVDRDKSLLKQAIKSINLRKEGFEQESDSQIGTTGKHHPLCFYTTDMEEARELLARELGCTILKETAGHILMYAHGKEFMIVKISPRSDDEFKSELL